MVRPLMPPDQKIREHPLYDVLSAAILQVTDGKGARHGGDVTPFLEQPWLRLAEAHGIGFLTGQAAKKLEEAVTNYAPGDDAYTRELLGAMVYIGMAVLFANSDT